MLEASLGNWAAPEATVPLVGRVRAGGVCVDRWWALGGDRGSWLELRLSSASWVIGKAPASAQQLGMSLGCSVMGKRAVAASVLCGLCRQLRNLIQTCRPALCLCCSASSSHPTPSCCPPTVRLTPHHNPPLCIPTCIRLRVVVCQTQPLLLPAAAFSQH